ncbi:16S rRNA (guanine(527)-N(7))-methyltransferase RsmG [Thermicanus aegyptius]|uniref:16S rRNA (guanine(527)-N(7))-methyltransferase RsmG n=1 Tax=Thermicanus aegyptius TaxID=94009 RepID=UPI000402D65C|nr:16S rRNA (guanine(527)-N(7))-methyltransferase RsmG [Thermicanus aegyptius]
MPHWFNEEIKKAGIKLDERKVGQFRRYYEMLVLWNERINLTAITDEEGVYEKHFYDSLMPTFFTPFNQVHRIADIGSGAGFPSIPIKIIFPHLQVVVVDSLKKRITFLEELVKELGLDRVELIHGRAEEVGRKPYYRESFPIVLARAVARLNILLEFTLPFVEVGGYFIAMKGKSGEQELKDSMNALKVLRGKVDKIEKGTLPIEKSERILLWIKKEGSIPDKYPRNGGKIEKKPL